MKYLNWVFLLAIFLVYPILFESRFNRINIDLINHPPNLSFIAGTDSLGRDFMLRCIQGSVLSVLIAILSLMLSHLIGFFVGSLSVFRIFYVNVWLPRLIDLLDSIPSHLMVCVLALFWQHFFSGMNLVVKSVISLILSISMVSWMSTARIVRQEILQLIGKDFISNSILLGANNFELIRSHFLKHTGRVLLISMTQHLPHFVLVESFLSYLGIGVVPPYLSLGSLISEGWKHSYSNPYLFIFPSIFLVFISIEFKLLLNWIKG